MSTAITRRVAAVIGGVLALAACGSADADGEASAQWAEEFRVGEFTPEDQDWEAIEAAAIEEGTVSVYSVSSRMESLGEVMQDKYGIELSFVDIGSRDQTERFAREYNADIHEVDVLFNNDAATMVNTFMPQGMVHNFVPDIVRDEVDADDLEPIVVQRWNGRVFMYNSAAYPDGAPIDTLWALTEPEWRSKFQMSDPATDGAQADTILTILQHPDQMAAAYETEYGEELTEYSSAVVSATEQNPAYNEPDAAIEWLYRLLENEPVFVDSTTDISAQVGNVDDPDPPIGSATYGRIRDVESGVLEWLPAYDVEPAMGVFYPNVLAVADQAPNPNAAKLVIREMMTEDGFAPWNDPGDYATNASIQQEQLEEFGEETMPAFDDLNSYLVDGDYQETHRRAFLELYLSF